MARDFNQNRNANAKLGIETIDKYGKTFAIQYGLDGFSAINNVVEPTPTDIKEYLEGNDNITIFACASNIDKLCEYALMSFPNIKDLYLFKTSAVVTLEDNLDYLLDLNKIYVPSDLLSAYISAYPTLSSKFDTIVEDYTLTIPFVGDTTLTSEYVDSVIAMLSSADKNAITKLVIPTDFSEESANDIAWHYDFSAIVNLNNNIWYGATQYDFTTITISGSGALTSAIVESAINSIQSSKLSGITKVVVDSGFTSAESTNILDTYLSQIPNCTNLIVKSSIKNLFSSSQITYLEYSQMSKLNSSISVPVDYRNRTIDILYRDITSASYNAGTIAGAGNYYISACNIRMFYPKLSTSDAQFFYCQINRNDNVKYKIFFGSNSISYTHGTYDSRGQSTYCSAQVITTYIWYAWNSNSKETVGVIDGSNVYTDKGFEYPKLSSELTIDTTNGHLIENGVDLFNGYTATWYSDEECTTTIQPSYITSDMTVYVKLTAI